MRKFLKWTAIVLGSIVLLIIITIAVILIRHDRYGFYPSGGVLSENQAKYDILFYDLNLEINSFEQSIAGYTTVKLKSLADSLNQIELDLIDNFDVSNLSSTYSTALDFEHDDDKLWITLKNSLNKNNITDLKIDYQGQPVEALMPPWIGGFNWSKDSTGADWIGLSCQGEGAKIWFPCKDHPSDEPDSVAINITIPEPYYCASNGLLRAVTKPKEGFQTFHWITHYPINNYNINVSIGKYEILTREYITKDGNSMPVMFYVLPQAKKGAAELIDMAVDMLYTYRKYYGEYPFTKEKFGIVYTDFLGMEHQTINAYGNRYRYQTVNGKKYDWLMLHEMGHEWWGNKVTANDWADFWIHEGICTYGEALYQLDKGGEEAYHNYMKRIKRKIRNKKPIIPKRNATEREAYRGDIYSKGAYFMHSLRYVLGDSIFFKTLKQFATDSSFTYQKRVTTDDFLELVNRNSKKDYSKFFHLYLNTTELPEIKIDSLSVDSFEISIPNIDFELPMNVTLDNQTQKMILSQTPIKVQSKSKPKIDEENWLLKKFTEKS